MRVRTDDELYRVDRTYLGPKGRRLPWRATYRAYGVWLMAVLAFGAATFKLGAPISLLSVIAVLYVSALVTIWIMKRLDQDRPLVTLPVIMWHELTAPRPPLSRQIRRYRVEVHAQTGSRRWSRRVMRRRRR